MSPEKTTLIRMHDSILWRLKKFMSDRKIKYYHQALDHMLKKEGY